MSLPLPLENDPQDVALADDGDILIDAEGLHFVSGSAAIAQLVRMQVLLFAGEWFLNQDIGVPYYEELIGDASKKAGVEDRARAAFAAAVLSVPGVEDILQLNVSINTNTRQMTVIIQAKCAFGDTGVITLTVPS